MTRSFRYWGGPRALWLIAAFALAIRLAVLLLTGDAPVSTDERHWHRLGVAFQEQGLMSPRAHTYRPPLYPLLIAAAYHLAGQRPDSVRLFQAILGAATCLLVYRVGARLGSGDTGLLAAAAAAVYPLFVLFASLLMAEVLLVFLVMLCVLAAVRLFEREGALDAVMLGASFGIAGLCKPVVLGWVPVLGLAWIVFAMRRRREASWSLSVADMGARALGVIGGMLVVIAPWTVRNAAMTGHFVPVSTNLGVNLVVGHEPGADGGYRDGVDYLAMCAQLVDGETNAAVGDRLVTRHMLARMLAAPGRTLKLALRKVVRFWNPWVTDARGWQAAVGLVSAGPVIVLGLWGLWKLRRTPAGIVVASLVVALTLVHALVFAHTRFRLPVDAALLAPAALMVQRLWHVCREILS